MQRKHYCLLFLLCFCFIIDGASAQQKIKVACVGNSITEGWGLTKTYPQVLQQQLGEAYEVRNFGVSGRTLLKKGDFPYWNEARYQEALAWHPDVVIIKLGTNDSKQQNWGHNKDFVKDYKALVKSFRKLPSKPHIMVCLPLPVFEDKWSIREQVVKEEVIPKVQKAARKSRVELIDLYTPFAGKPELTYDGVHPNEAGAALLASEVARAIQASKALGRRKH